MVDDLAALVADPQALLSIFSAIAVFATIVTVAMPLLQQDELANRMKSAALERDKIRARERARLVADKNKVSLRSEQGGSMANMVDKLNLRKALADEKTFLNLKMAGFRKQSHIYVFLFFRVVLPLVMLLIAAIYVFGISNMERTFMIKLLIVLLVGYAGFYAPNMYISNIVKKRQLSVKTSLARCFGLNANLC